MNFYISDLHIGHDNILKHDNRPFNNMQQMIQMIVYNWNSVVGKTDDVYILGDFFWSNQNGRYLANNILPKLNGNKYLINGNHDKLYPEVEEKFVWIKDYAEIKDEEERVVLFHYPIAHWNHQSHGSVLLYGHTHTGRDIRPFEKYRQFCIEEGIPFRCCNVGCMLPYMGYTPRTLKYLKAVVPDLSCN